MTRKNWFGSFAIAVLVLLPTFSEAQLWTGVLNPSRAIDWSKAGVTGGITNRTTVCSTLSAGATAAQINSAISACPGGQVVKLNAGTYTLGGGISLKSNVTLRGAGANQTFLNITGGTPCLLGNTCAIAVTGGGTYQGSPDNEPPPFSTPSSQRRIWVGTNGVNGVYTKGATTINLNSAPTGLNVGDNLILYQSDDAGPTSGLFICQTTTAGCSREGSRGNAQQQIVQVVSVSGSAVTISPGILADNWVSAKNPRVGWWGGTITGVGVENLSVNSGSTTLFSNIGFWNAADSWVKGVASQETGARDHIMAMHSRNITVQDSFISLSCVGGCDGAATGYGLETWGATYVLLQNNILKNVQSPFLFSAATTALVVGFNYSPPCASGCGTGATNLASHEEGFMFGLYEANDVDHLRADTFHGTQVFGTVFRNHAVTNGEAAVDIWAFNRYWNIIGNVLGNNTSNRYECISPDSSSACGRYNANIYRLGFAGANAGSSPEAGVAQDTILGSTTMRWGNYDTVTATNRFVAGEVPSALSSYANPIPPNTNLPASFYLTAKPAWWPSAKAWPVNGPDVSGGNISGVAGHANTLPAQDCYTSISGNIANFNADSCYPIGAAPIPPTGLQATVR